MKIWRTIGVLLLCLALAGTIACSPLGGDNGEAEQQLVEVVRGDLIVSVSGSGNIEVSNEARLAFGTGGKVEKLYVDEGDYVTEGDALAKLDTDDLELALTQARIALTQAQLAVSSANVTLRAARHGLDEARDIYTWPDIQEAEADVDEAEAYVEYVLTNLEEATTQADQNRWTLALVYAQARLTAAEAVLDAKVHHYDTEEVAIKKMEVEVAEQTLVLRQQSLEQAQQSLEQAQKNLDEATITTPFDGVVASVYVEEGDVIPSPTMAPKTVIYLVDPTSMELEVEVDEIDMPGVKLGQKAIIDVDALPDTLFEGEVTAIYPVPLEQGGVIVYQVKIELSVPEGSGIMIGMSTDADIIITERSNVLLVPDRAIKQDSEGNHVVEVMVNGKIEERPVVVGLSDGFETEIIDGLKEGEIVFTGKRS
jgi:HlyD family secretion protein